MNADAPVLECRGLGRRFALRGGLFGPVRWLHAVADVSLKVPQGSITAIVGESGCGKSTLARLLVGLDAPDEGEMFIEGRPIGALGRSARAAAVQPVFQDPVSSLNPRRTVGEIVRFPLDAQGRGTQAARAARVREMLDLVNLSPHLEHSYPNQLSGGQAQRVAIARALALAPRALVCDEPTSALDVSVQAHILNLLLDLRDRTGVAIVLISHDMAVVETLADRVAVMYLGRIVEEGPAEDVFTRPHHPYTRALFASVMAPDAGAGLPQPAFRGLAPNPVDLPSGCAFHPRCPLAAPVCGETRPGLEARGSQRAACHFAPSGAA